MKLVNGIQISEIQARKNVFDALAADFILIFELNVCVAPLSLTFMRNYYVANY